MHTYLCVQCTKAYCRLTKLLGGQHSDLSMQVIRRSGKWLYDSQSKTYLDFFKADGLLGCGGWAGAATNELHQMLEMADKDRADRGANEAEDDEIGIGNQPYTVFLGARVLLCAWPAFQ